MSRLSLITPKNVKRAIKGGLHFLKNRTRHVPLGVNYDLTWKCNLKCKHCYFTKSKNELSRKYDSTFQELSDKQWINLFKYHSDLGVVSASLTGGEPTLRMNLIESALELFPTVQVASNGIIKLPHFQNVRQPVYWVSLDGGEEMHNKIRGANVFEKVIDNIKDDKRVTISHTITSLNYKELEKVVEIAYNTGVSGIFFLLYTGYSNDPLLVKGDKLRSVVKGMKKVLDEYGDFIILSEKMLELYVSKEFVPYCIFKMGGIKSYYPNGQLKFCVMGNSENLCENCGCIVPVAAYAIGKFDYQTIQKIQKFSF
ncbi:MAG: 4Fe-4S cluster-binding domain-containing protein [Candidatus Lokiarchaeota archaeon]|nr:4Fe-4S cluster-binding domain-containing protein [Candidatus Lokiarchaeota archaeon]MBD3201391.1 4Fe-4S cluster-binding domain-containing protein [Candidatus Lokiarchaeota archaeon]